MPTPAEKLTKDSGDGQIKAAISASIAMLMDEGMEQDQAIAAAYGMAEKATGKTLGKKS